jgi:hypothetical protein
VAKAYQHFREKSTASIFRVDEQTKQASRQNANSCLIGLLSNPEVETISKHL